MRQAASAEAMLALLVTALIALALLTYVGGQALGSFQRRRAAGRRRRRARGFDPGAERRAERKARQLLRSIVNPEEWEMYRELGLIRVDGRMSGPAGRYCYLIYPHKPIVAYLPGSNSLLSEYCVEFLDDVAAYGRRLPDSDDVLAKWLMIEADEERLVRRANMHLPGRQVDPQHVRRDLVRLREWDRGRRLRPAASAKARVAAQSTIATGDGA